MASPLRKYAQVWEQIKEKKTVTVTVRSRGLINTIKRGVIKEKSLDTLFQAMNSGSDRPKLYITVDGLKITFVLSTVFNVTELKTDVAAFIAD